MRIHRVSALLCSTFLLTPAIVSGEAITAENRGYFSLTAVEPVRNRGLSYKKAIEDDFNQIGKAAFEAEWDRKRAELKLNSPEYYRHQAALSDMKAQWFPELKQGYLEDKLYWLEKAKNAEKEQQQRAWDIEEATYTPDTPEWYEFKARVEEAKSEWYYTDPKSCEILKENQQFYLQSADRAKQQRAWDLEEATYTPNTLEWFEFKAKVNGAKAEWFDRGSASYAILKANYSAYKVAAGHLRQQNAWDVEEATYTPNTPEWFEFKAKVDGAKAEWFDRGSENYTNFKANHSIYKTAAEQARQQNAWDVEEANYTPNTPEWFEFKAKVEEAKAEWFDRGSHNYCILKANQQIYLQQAESAIRRKREAEAEAEAQRRRQAQAEQERQHRISVGHRQLQEVDYQSILSIIERIFNQPIRSGMPLTYNDIAEIMFYIPQYIKDRLRGRMRSFFEIIVTPDVVSRILAREWSAFSEIVVDFEDDGSMFDASDDEEQQILATPEIERFLESNLKRALKSLLYDRIDDLIETNWAEIYRNFAPEELNGIRRELVGRNLSDVATIDLETSIREDLEEALRGSSWEYMRGLLVRLKFIDFDAIGIEWQKIYNPRLDLDPKRAFDPSAPFTDREVGALTTIARVLKLASSEGVLIKVASTIYPEQRARAIVKKYLAPFDASDEDEEDE